MTLKERFNHDIALLVATNDSLNVVVVAVRLPTGAVEVITNTTSLWNKLEYYQKAYDNEFKLKTNMDIKIIGYMIA